MFRCNQCTKTFEDHSAIRRHLSIKHFNYFPYICKICKKAGENHTTATEEDMDKHISAIHQGSDCNITLSRNKIIEDNIKAAIDECRLPTLQSISRDFKTNFHYGSNAPKDRSPFRGTAIESGPVSSHVTQGGVTQGQNNGETTENVAITTQNAAEDDIEIVFESAPQKVKDEVSTPKDISLGLKNALRRTYDILCDETTVDTSAKEVECFSSEIKQELSNNEATENITADENNDSNNKVIEKVTVHRETSINLLEKTSELCTKNLGRESLTAESNSCANDAPIFTMQSHHGSPTMSSPTPQSQAQLNSVAVSNEIFNQNDEENFPQNSNPTSQSTEMPLPSVEGNVFSDEQNTDEEFNEHIAIVPTIQMRLRSSSNKYAANLIQRKRTLPMNDRHNRSKLSSKRSNPKKTNGAEKLNKCDQCSYASAWKGHVVRHMRTHTGEKPFKCGHCSFACSQKVNLNNHLRTHTGQKPYKCDVCPYASAHIGHLNEHMRTHTGEKPFKCSVCSFASATSSVLIVHNRTHTGEKPYKCSECAFAGSSSSSLCHHVRCHHSKKTE